MKTVLRSGVICKKCGNEIDIQLNPKNGLYRCKCGCKQTPAYFASEEDAAKYARDENDRVARIKK